MAQSDHLLVLVHGLWGNVSHFDYITRAIDEFFTVESASEPNPDPHVLVCRSNEGYKTYDGIDVCGEKVANEIEAALHSYEQAGIPIRRLSVVGYSLGGLMARYAIGLLYQRGWFKKLTPVNFTTFCSPHLGVRAPGRDLATTMFNTFVPRTISATGRQLFLNDQFATTGMPLLSFLADKGSIFFHALTLFPHRALYANVVNDIRTAWFTSAIQPTDPFLDLVNYETNCLPGYETTILDAANPVVRRRAADDDVAVVDHAAPPAAAVKAARQLLLLQKALLSFVTTLLVSPVWVLAFLISAAIQTFYSSRRLREFHSNHKGRYGMDEFRLLRLDEQVEDVVETVLGDLVPYGLHSLDLDAEEPKTDGPTPAVLDLAPQQLTICRNLNTLEWERFPVHITKTKAAHAAVIVRHMDWKGMEEGEVVIRHWLNEVLVV
ncbi:putative serine esterase-domain-containing protein [Dipodascopsis tothii]|uniref:putative serine esterase-domain-containing protein n=1 Tax=Dipodascopsis tothii TaxID=44089 RepID=UPI0034CE67E8